MNFAEWIIKQLIDQGKFADGLGWWLYWMIGMLVISFLELLTNIYWALPIYFILTGLFLFQRYIRNLYKRYLRERE